MASGKEAMRRKKKEKAKAMSDRAKGKGKKKRAPLLPQSTVNPDSIPAAVIEDILAKRDLLVHPDLARSVATRYLGKHPVLVKAMQEPGFLRTAAYEPLKKWVRQELRVLVGMFVVESDPSKLLDSNTDVILAAHRSTLERLPHYPQLYAQLFDGKNPQSILDLCAGLNGCSYDYFGCTPKYTAVDVSPQLMDFVAAWLHKRGIPGTAFAADVSRMDSYPEGDTVFLFKATDVLERVRYGVGERMLNQLVVKENRRVIVSFATATISGTREISFNKRAWVERWCERVNRSCRVVDTVGERYYIIE